MPQGVKAFAAKPEELSSGLHIQARHIVQVSVNPRACHWGTGRQKQGHFKKLQGQLVWLILQQGEPVSVKEET